MAYNKKKMYKKGSFLEPNKELTFGGAKKMTDGGTPGPVTRQIQNFEAAKRGAANAEAKKKGKNK